MRDGRRQQKCPSRSLPSLVPLKLLGDLAGDSNSNSRRPERTGSRRPTTCCGDVVSMQTVDDGLIRSEDLKEESGCS